MNTLSALVVDDSKSARLFLKNLLEDQQIHVYLAASGAQALSWLESHRPDAVFLDHVMVEMDGLEVLARLKENAATVDIPVVMCTSNNEENFIRQVETLGALTVLSKPPTPSLLSQVLTRLHVLKEEAEARDLERRAAEGAVPSAVAAESAANEAAPTEAPSVAVESAVAVGAEPAAAPVALPSIDDILAQLLPRAEELFAHWSEALRSQLVTDVETRLVQARDDLHHQMAAHAESQLAGMRDGAQAQVSEIVESRLSEQLAGFQRTIDDRVQQTLKKIEKEIDKLRMEKQGLIQSFGGTVRTLVHDEMESNFFATEAYIKSKAEEIMNPPIEEWRRQLFNDSHLKDDMKAAVVAATRDAAEHQWEQAQEVIKKLDVAAIVESRVANSAAAVQTVMREEMAAAVRESSRSVMSKLITVGVAAAIAGGVLGAAIGKFL